MGTCGGNCGSCSGCGRELELTEKEIDLLNTLAQIPFLPVARRLGEDKPIYPEAENVEEMSLVLQCLEKKNLISLDYDKPLKGCEAGADYPIQGSMALTQRGQQVLELMEYQGIRRG